MSFRAPRASFAGLASVIVLAACSSSSRVSPPDGADAGVPSGGGSSGSGGVFFDDCAPGGFVCEGDTAIACDSSTGEPPRDCAAEGSSCRSPQGCVACTPNEGSCQDGVARHCRADGTEWFEFQCDARQGMVCESDGCKGSCSPAELGDGYVGCDYYPTVTPNPVYSGFHFAVAVANTGSQDASVLVTRGTQTSAEQTVPPGQLRIIELPWVSELKGGDQDACQVPPALSGTRLVEDGAYRLRSDHPVSVYQFNPLEYELSPAPASCPLREQCPGSPPRDEGCLSFSNDATLLFPSNVLTGSYTALTWPSTAAGEAFLSIVGTEEDTVVRVMGSAAVAAGGGMDDTGSGQVTIGRGDVLQVLAERGALQSYGSDLSGTVIDASRPVQVIGGSACGFVPEATTDACDHLEHALLPAETLGQDYLVTFPAAPASASPQAVRVMPVVPNTTIEFDRPMAGMGASVVRSPSDGPLDIPSLMQDVRITADHPILVSHYLQGRSSVDSGAGDPSMAVVVPRAQYRDDYIFTASRTYDFNYVNVVAPADAAVLLDGEAIPPSEFSDIGDTPFRVARHRLPADREVFHVEGSAPFGLVVYGYGKFTSYMYPGGLDLQKISPPIIR